MKRLVTVMVLLVASQSLFADNASGDATTTPGRFQDVIDRAQQTIDKADEGGQSKTPPSKNAGKKANSKEPSTRISLEAPKKSAWKYHQSIDPMTSQKVLLADTISTNTISLASPYEGPQHALLWIRNGKTNDAAVSFSEGQINWGMCKYENTCTVVMRTDENKPKEISVSPPSDHSTSIFFINNYKRFINDIRNAKTVRFQVEFYRNGSQVIMFNVADINLR